MNIFLQEIKNYRRSTIIWIVTICVLVFGFLSIYKSFAVDATSAKQLLETYPPAVLAALNLKIEIFFTIYGFFAYLLTFIGLTGAIQAMNLGVSVLSKEVAGKTADFLLTKPVTRTRMLVEKFSAVFTLILITNAFYLGTTAFAAQIFSKETVNFTILMLIAASLFFVQMFFLSIGFLFGAIIPKIKTVVAVSLPTVFVFFIISAFGSVLKIPNINYYTPFKYFDPIYIYNNSAYETKYLWLLFGVMFVSLATSFVVYLKKDIEAAS